MERLDYIHTKEMFEKTHFKLMTPPTYVRITPYDGLKFLSWGKMVHCYQNLFCLDRKVRFINLWVHDPTIRTYETLQDYEASI